VVEGIDPLGDWDLLKLCPIEDNGREEERRGGPTATFAVLLLMTILGGTR